jgi:hypothetical protein
VNFVPFCGYEHWSVLRLRYADRADHSGATDGIEKGQGMQRSWTESNRAQPEIAVDRLLTESHSQETHNDDARWNGRSLKILNLPGPFVG